MKTAVLGYGTVGKGVYDQILSQKTAALQAGPVLVQVGEGNEPFMVFSVDDIVSDAEVGAVAEAMGGVEPAFTFASAALKAGKGFTTSNKALVAAKGVELNALAVENNAGFLFSAACGGGMPILRNLKMAADTDEIIEVGGILNGTTNFILDSMQSEGLGYGEALSIAQKLGFAERNPAADVSGLDTMRKIILCSAVAFAKMPDAGYVYEGIENITAEDCAYISGLGYTARLVGLCRKNADGSIAAYVEPALYKKDSIYASIKKNFNLSFYEGKFSGRITLSGQGAGRYPTASAVVRDLYELSYSKHRMLDDSCTYADADCSGAFNRYLVREDGKYAFVEKASVLEMKNKALKAREEGKSFFYAAVKE